MAPGTGASVYVCGGIDSVQLVELVFCGGGGLLVKLCELLCKCWRDFGHSSLLSLDNWLCGGFGVGVVGVGVVLVCVKLFPKLFVVTAFIMLMMMLLGGGGFGEVRWCRCTPDLQCNLAGFSERAAGDICVASVIFAVALF